MVRCKFRCTQIETTPDGYFAKFIAVSGDSEENKKYWKATPSGDLQLNYLNEMPFETGKEYYLDISLAE